MPESTLHAPQLAPQDQSILARHTDWWKRKGTLYAEVSDAPLGELWLPLADGSLATEDLDLLPEMLDIERLAGDPLEPGPLELDGDRFRTRAPYARVPWVEAILGCPIRATIQGGSMRTRSFISSWEEWEARASRRDDEWFQLLAHLVELLVERSGGHYAVVQTLMRGPSDLAEAILGPQMMSFSLYDHPRELRRFLDTVTQAFIEILHAQLERIPPIEGGYVNPFGVWALGTVVRTQCDATAFLSPEQYATWFRPYDERICESVDYSIIHLHSGSLHTVDVLLEVERPQAIQITLDPEPAGPPWQSLLPTFRKILHHKPLMVDGPLSPEDAQRIRDEVPPDGLYVSARLTPW